MIFDHIEGIFNGCKKEYHICKIDQKMNILSFIRDKYIMVNPNGNDDIAVSFKQ